MAEEVRVSTPGPNGNGFSLDLREKKLGLTGPNVALLLLIIIVGGVAYLRTGTINQTLKAGQEQLTATETRVQTHISELAGRIDKLLEAMQAQQVLLTAHTTTLTTGQQALATRVDAVAQSIEAWVHELETRQELMNHNILHPDRALPLRAPAPQEGRPPEHGR